jgi:hypothetical protein
LSSGQYIRLSLDSGSRAHLFLISQFLVIRSADTVLKRKVKRAMKSRSGGRSGGEGGDRGRGGSRNVKTADKVTLHVTSNDRTPHCLL